MSCEGELITLVHGDLHNNNMMFLEREEEGDMHFKLLDWQMVKVSPIIPPSSLYFL
jgi:aminoglycoside phosphotransferase (APT) family kinase protein